MSFFPAVHFFLFVLLSVRLSFICLCLSFFHQSLFYCLSVCPLSLSLSVSLSFISLFLSSRQYSSRISLSPSLSLSFCHHCSPPFHRPLQLSITFCHESHLLVSSADMDVISIFIGHALILIIGCVHTCNSCSDWPCPGILLAIGTSVYHVMLLIGHFSPTL